MNTFEQPMTTHRIPGLPFGYDALSSVVQMCSSHAPTAWLNRSDSPRARSRAVESCSSSSHFIERLLVATSNGDLRALRNEKSGSSKTDATVATSNKRLLACELHHAYFLRDRHQI